jgi:hypothetical protein
MGSARDPLPWRLPNLPNAGYATQREKGLSDAIMQFLRDIERHRFTLLTIVIAGKEQWRVNAQETWRALRIGEDHQLLDSVFSYLELLSVRPGVQRMLLKAHNNPQQWRTIMDAARPHLEREREQVRRLENGWRG